jgi:hypothetical protein
VFKSVTQTGTLNTLNAGCGAIASPAFSSVHARSGPTQSEQPRASALNTLNAAGAAIETPVFKSVQRCSTSTPAVRAAQIIELVRNAGGTLRTITRRLGAQVGRPAASVHGELRRLANAGLISLSADSRGTLITVVPVRRPN